MRYKRYDFVRPVKGILPRLGLGDVPVYGVVLEHEARGLIVAWRDLAHEIGSGVIVPVDPADVEPLDEDTEMKVRERLRTTDRGSTKELMTTGDLRDIFAVMVLDYLVRRLTLGELAKKFSIASDETDAKYEAEGSLSPVLNKIFLDCSGYDPHAAPETEDKETEDTVRRRFLQFLMMIEISAYSESDRGEFIGGSPHAAEGSVIWQAPR